MVEPPPGHKGSHSVRGTPELPILEQDPITPELFKPGTRKDSSVCSVTSSSHDQLETDVIGQQLRAAEAAAQVEKLKLQLAELKLQLAKRKLLASSHGSNASGGSRHQTTKHADKYLRNLRAYQSPGVDNTMAGEQPVDPNGPCAADQYSLTTKT